jgi:Tol biopolymer transport system component
MTVLTKLAAAAALCLTVCFAAGTGTASGASSRPSVGASSGRLPVFAGVVRGDARAHLVVGRLGGAAHRIFTSQTEGGITGLAVSPSGKKIAFVEMTSDSKVRLDVINVDGSGLRRLTVGARAYDEHPVWSRDGSTVFFALPYVPSDPAANSYYRVWRVPADGSTPPTRIDGASYVFPTSARKGGKWLALGSDRPDTGYGRCAVMRVGGAHLHNVGPDNCADALWRPRSSTLAISRVVRDQYSTGPTVQIWLLSLKTGRYHPVPHVQAANRSGRAYPLAWTRRGSFLYFERRSSDGQHVHIYRIRADGSGKTNVTPSIPQSRTDDLAVQSP